MKIFICIVILIALASYIMYFIMEFKAKGIINIIEDNDGETYLFLEVDPEALKTLSDGDIVTFRVTKSYSRD